MTKGSLENIIAIIGLGNIGLPLAIEFGKKFKTIGFDVDKHRVDTLQQGIDIRNTSTEMISISEKLTFTSEYQTLQVCNIFIIAVQTSTNNDGTPNINALINASQTVAKILKKNDLVIFESTVFPGCTEEICVPILEQFSGLTYNSDFFVGYSPERINTGDSVHTLTNTIKITAGSNTETAQKVDKLYQTIIKAGTHLVSSIKTAEAAKLLENAQRDINIAFMNEVAAILTGQNISFEDVWNASSTKWNFLKFSPGLVGGECLPLASNYLQYLSKDKEGVLHSSRMINDSFPQTIAQVIEEKIKTDFPNLDNAKLLVLGITYKPDSPDCKNSLVPLLVNSLINKGFDINCYDPIAVNAPLKVIDSLTDDHKYHLIIKASKHSIFEQLNYSLFTHPDYLIFDIQQFSFHKGKPTMAEN